MRPERKGAFAVAVPQEQQDHPQAQITTRQASSSQRRRSSLTVVDTSRSPYAPGALRASTDVEHERVRRFCVDHPEYERALGHEGLRQVAATFLDDDDQAVRGEIRAAGVPMGFRRVESDDVNPAWSDEQ